MTINYEEWRKSDSARRAAIEPILKEYEKVRRMRPRTKVEADFLRRIGTPERLIGPVIQNDPSD